MIELPSQHQIGEKVYLNLSSTYKQVKDKKKSEEDFTAKVVGVHFTMSKVKYDLELRFAADPGEDEECTRIYNIDSCFVWQVPVDETI